MTKEEKIKYVMGEFKEGTLKDSHGNIVTDKKQALVIALSEAEDLKKGGTNMVKSEDSEISRLKDMIEEHERLVKVLEPHADMDKKVADELEIQKKELQKYKDKLNTLSKEILLDKKQKDIIKKGILSGQIDSEKLIDLVKGKSETNKENDVDGQSLIKARTAQMGEVRTWKGQKMKKTPDGWKPVTELKTKKQEDTPKDKQKSLDEYAKETSGTDLERAAKDAKDTEVRKKANEELQRREQEEKPQESNEKDNDSQVKPDEKDIKKETMYIDGDSVDVRYKEVEDNSVWNKKGFDIVSIDGASPENDAADEAKDVLKNYRDKKLNEFLLNHYSGGKSLAKLVRNSFGAEGYKYIPIGDIELRIANHSASGKLQGKNQLSIITHENDPTEDKFLDSENYTVWNKDKDSIIDFINGKLKNKLNDFIKEFKNNNILSLNDINRAFETSEEFYKKDIISEKEYNDTFNDLMNKAIEVNNNGDINKDDLEEIYSDYNYTDKDFDDYIGNKDLSNKPSKENNKETLPKDEDKGSIDYWVDKVKNSLSKRGVSEEEHKAMKAMIRDQAPDVGEKDLDDSIIKMIASQYKLGFIKDKE